MECRTEADETMFFARDNRTGIDQSEHQEIFGLFYKVNKKSEEIGSGPAIANRIIEVKGRTIRIGLGRGKVPLYVFRYHQRNEE